MLTSEQHRCAREKQKFQRRVKRESTQLVADQNYSVVYTFSAMDVGLTDMTRWVTQLRDDRPGKCQKLPHNSGTNRMTHA